jgi:predicted methyltransferase
MRLGIIWAALGACLIVSVGSGARAQSASAAIASAIADPGRPAADVALDGARHPSEILTFIGLKSGQKIVDVFPGPYWDRLFSKVVGPKGKVIAFLPVEIIKAGDVKAPAEGAPALPGYPNVSRTVAPIDAFSTAGKVDVVWIRQNYHDLYDPFMGPANVPAFNRAVFMALRHGGLFVIIDHSAPDGSGLADTNTTHRIDAAVVKKDMAAAGFVFAGESNVLRNPADTRDKLVFDKTIRGHTDQFVYLFRKP